MALTDADAVSLGLLALCAEDMPTSMAPPLAFLVNEANGAAARILSLLSAFRPQTPAI